MNWKLYLFSDFGHLTSRQIELRFYQTYGNTIIIGGSIFFFAIPQLIKSLAKKMVFILLNLRINWNLLSSSTMFAGF